MRSAKSVGRTVGLISLVRLLLAPLVYVGLMPPVARPGFLESAAGSALQVRVAVLLAFVLGALTLAIAIAAMPVLRRHSESMTLSFLALSVVGLATLAADNVAILTMVSLSQEYAKASAPAELLQALGRMARSAWRGAHFTNLMIGHATGFLFALILYRFALVPRALAAFGVVAALVSTPAVTMPLLGYRFTVLLIIPAALSNLALIIWLLVRGFDERQDVPDGRAAGVEFVRG